MGYYLANKPGIKIDKRGNFTFINSVDLAAYTLTECVIAAYRDSARLILKRARSKIPRRTGRARLNMQSWVRRKNLDLVLGYKRRFKGFYSIFFEIGAKNVKRTEPLLTSVEESRSDIEAIFARYLKEYLPKLSPPENGAEGDIVDD
jgi:hypothetical protein